MFLEFLITGIFSSFIVLGWQCYKDSPWENFVLKKFLRTLIIAPLISIALYFIVKRNLLQIKNLGILLLFTISIERVIGEVYKGFIRKGSHKEYEKLFERLNINFNNHFIRIIIGIIVSILITYVVVYASVKILELIFYYTPNDYIRGVLSGILGGSLCAIGGAIKDSQFEGFKIKKFIRSPLVGLIGGIILINYTQNLLVLLLSITGFERVIVELYKTFIKRQVRGIFENQKPKYTNWQEKRWIFFLLYLIGFIAFVLLLLKY